MRLHSDSFLAMPRLELALWLAAFVVASIAILAVWGPEAWGPVRVFVSGALLGAMSFYMLFINRLLVS